MNSVIASAGFFYGVITIAIFLFPLFLYASEYSDIEKQGRGTVNSGDMVGMIGQVLLFHIMVVFFAALTFGGMELAFTNIPSFSPSVVIKSFYMTGEAGDINTFINKWFNAGAITATNNPLLSSGAETMRIGVLLIGFALTFVYILIPVLIMGFSIKYALGGKEEMRDESSTTRVIGSFGFFIGATLLYFIHSLFASALVWTILSGSSTKFSFYKGGVEIWKKLLGI